MLSFFSSKPAAPKEPNALPKIVDFNTIDKTSSLKTDQLLTKNSSRFSIWPFGSKNTKSDLLKDQNNDNKSFVINPNDKVISMKKVDSSSLDYDASITETDVTTNKVDDINKDEEFIDIQLRQLSYAEVAALDLSRKHLSSKTIVATSKKSETNNNEVIVVDEEKELEKSITDMEMAESYKCHERINSGDLLMNHMNFLSPDDEWELNNETKANKKAKRSKKTKNSKKQKPKN